MFSVGDDFLTTRNVSQYSFEDHSSLVDSGMWTSAINTPQDVIHEVASQVLLQSQNNTVVRLEPAECFQRYIATFQSDYRNLLLVTDNATTTVKYLETRFYRDFVCNNEQASVWACAYASQNTAGYSNQCTSACDTPNMTTVMEKAIAAGTWSPLDDPVKYCLAQPSEAPCTLNISIAVLTVVVLFNAIKIGLMLLTLFYALPRASKPLLCIGDAVASFLDVPDAESANKSLLSRKLYNTLCLPDPGAPPTHRSRIVLGPVVQTYKPRSQHWFDAVSGRRWTFCVFIYLAGLATASGYLAMGINNLTSSKNIRSLWSMGFGNVNVEAIVMTSSNASGTLTLIGNVLKANIAQIILSMLYFTYNGLFTGMLLSREWDSYALQRKGLRVNSTHPIGHQRSSYFLQLPYRWSLPLIVFSLVLHWLVSQSIFLVNVQMLDYFGQPVISGPNLVGHLITVGYSPIAIIFFIIIAGLLVLAVLATARVELRSGMPVASSCSMAIAAACQPPNPTVMKNRSTRDTDLPVSARLLQWGETGQLDPLHATNIRATWNEQAKGLSPRAAAGTSVTRGYQRVPDEDQIELNLLSLHTVVVESTNERSAIEAGGSVGDRIIRKTSKVPLVTAQEHLLVEGISVTGPVDSTERPNALYRCSFSAEMVRTPVEGREYA